MICEYYLHKPAWSGRVVTDGTGQSLRCGYVEMASHRDAERALLLQLKTFGITALYEGENPAVGVKFLKEPQQRLRYWSTTKKCGCLNTVPSRSAVC